MGTHNTTPEEQAQLTKEILAFARTRATEPGVVYGAMLLGGFQLAVADLGEQPSLAMMVHLFGDLVDMGRLLLDAGRVEPFDPAAPMAGRQGLPPLGPV